MRKISILAAVIGGVLVAVFGAANMRSKLAPPDDIQGELKTAQDLKLPDEIVADIRSRLEKSIASSSPFSRLAPTTSVIVGRPSGADVATPAVKDGPPAVPTPAQTLPPAAPPSSTSVVPAAGPPAAPPSSASVAPAVGPPVAPSSLASVKGREAPTLKLTQYSAQSGRSEVQVLATAKSIEDQLRTRTAAYTVPKKVKLNYTTEIALIIDGTNTGAASRLISEFPGTPTLTDAKVSDDVSARLTGPTSDVTVSLRGEEKRAITSVSPTKWIWDITPKKRGTIVLTLDVYAWVTVAGNAKPVEINTERWQIPVEATYWDITKEYAAEIDPVWKAVSAIGTGLVGILGWLGIQSFRKNSRKPPKRRRRR